MKRIVQGNNKKCKFGCIYCFTKENYQTNGQAPLNESELQDVELIQPFSDYDVFACENCNWENEIKSFTRYNKIISFATKAHITEQMACTLSNINRELMTRGAFLHIGISISTIKNIQEIEPRTTSFEKRRDGLKELYKYNIPCSVIIRPVLPTLDGDEIKNIVEQTYQYCNNYIYGPLYLNTEIEKYLQNKGYPIIKKAHRVNWRNGSLICYIYESKYQEKEIKNCCNMYGKKAFSSNADAVDNIKMKLSAN